MATVGNMSSDVGREAPEVERPHHGSRPHVEPADPAQDGLDADFEFRPGEASVVHGDDPVAVADGRRFRDVLGLFASGVAVVTSMNGDVPVGMTCQSFASVSLDPPLVLFVPAKTSRAWPLMQRSGRFCVNFLAEDQVAVSDVMASRGVDKFASLKWTPSQATGSPVIDGVLGYVDCCIHAVQAGGDHCIVVGRVLDLAAMNDKPPLLFFRGEYRSLQP
jgi:3-hydroxy-9,10-secoandrosta-1,3,5(10)-triene-9,17-dione monooxygenase reductase component